MPDSPTKHAERVASQARRICHGGHCPKRNNHINIHDEKDLDSVNMCLSGVDSELASASVAIVGSLRNVEPEPMPGIIRGEEIKAEQLTKYPFPIPVSNDNTSSASLEQSSSPVSDISPSPALGGHSPTTMERGLDHSGNLHRWRGCAPQAMVRSALAS